MRIFDSLFQDMRYALRMMKSSVGLTAVAVLSLALGIGATIALFSVIYALALRKLPVERPEELVEVERGEMGNLHSYAEWKIFRERQDIFSSVLAYDYYDVSFHLKTANQRQDVDGLYVSGEYFQTLGVSAVFGRVLQPSDDEPGAPPVCVLAYGLWRRLYGQSQDVLGRTILVNGNAFQIVGVAPQSFFGVAVGDISQIFMPLEAQRTYRDYPIQYGHQTPSLDDPATLISIAARLKPGVSANQANAGLQILAPEISNALTSRPDGNKWQRSAPKSLSVRSMQNGTSNEWLQDMDVVVLLMVMAAVALIIVCANLGNLLLARAAKRRSEIATRLAMGASRWRLVRQLLTESTALYVAGGVAGLLIARWGSQVLVWTLSYPPDDLLLLDLSWDAKVTAFAVGVTLACALLFGLAPAFGATQISLSSAMNKGTATGWPKGKFMNSALVVVQVALSVAVLVSAGLLARTLRAFLTQDLGYDPKGVVTAQATWQGAGTAKVGEEILKAFRSLPGVTSASAAWSPASSGSSNYRLPQLSVPGPGGSERRIGAYSNLVSSEFFETMRTPILAGRDFNDRDTATSPPVAILSEALAKALFGAVNPVGLRFRENDGDDSERAYSVEVIGVVRDIQYRRPDYGPLLIFYRPVSQCECSRMIMAYYEIRAAGTLATTSKRLESAAGAVDSRVSLKFDLLSNAMNGVLHRNRAMAWIATAFGLFVALLAMIGVYGVTAHATAERTREIGIRMALGAQRGTVLRMILLELANTAFAGLGLGTALAFAVGQGLRGMLFGVTPADPPSFVLAACLMVLVTGAAAFFPARRAANADPMIALRTE